MSPRIGWARRWPRVAGAVIALAGLALGMLPGGPAPAVATAADVTATDSAMTVSGRGVFADLRVTVSQTSDLINQAVTVSWTGGRPTRPNTGQFGVDYLQVMQCWGDDPNGPDRTQCQYGGSVTQTAPGAGAFVRSRQVNYGDTLVDPLETLRPGDDPTTPEDESRENVFVPFWAVGRDQPAPGQRAFTGRNDFFDAQITNEVPLARTRGDGTGEEHVEVQTVRQAAGLGCGAPVTSAGQVTGRSCWLVVVPRGATEIDGTARSGEGGNDGLISSPLSRTNWDNRLVVPMRFLPIGVACPLGAAERGLVGHEVVVDAVSRWQPSLCAGGGALFSYTQVSDIVARRQLESSDPGLVMITEPVPPADVPTGRTLVYAPVAVSALTFAFFIENQVSPAAPEPNLLQDGLRFTSLRLNQRLVAKLLTQSYRGAVTGLPDYLADNPYGLTTDPEFLQLNEQFRDRQYWTVVPDALVTAITADATAMLWRWVLADADARAFIAGTPDPWQAVVNEKNRNTELPSMLFPRDDTTCFGVGTPFTVCTPDAHPYANDMHEAGRAASRGDTLGRTASGTPNPDGTPKLTKVERQSPGRRGVLAVIDAEIAERYGMPTAALRNGAGEYVAPTQAALLTTVGAMRDGPVPGVLAADPATPTAGAYPLTTISYAATAPGLLAEDAARDYAAFLRYAAGPGQQPGVAPGQLPLGYAPLPPAMAERTRAVADQVQARVGRTTTQSTAPPAATTAPPAGNPPGAGPAAVVPPPPATAAPTTSADPKPVAQARPTPGTPAGLARHVLSLLLVTGGGALLLSPLARRIAYRRPAGPSVTPERAGR